MLCSRCHKNEASVFLKQIVNNKVTQVTLCGDCAQQSVLDPAAVPSVLLDLLAGFGGLLGAPSAKRPADPKCEGCGLRFSQFQAQGKLGCASCYDAFRPQLSDLLKRIHGAERHRGKSPGTSASPTKGTMKPLGKESSRTPPSPSVPDKGSLQKALKDAIAKEDFENAALLRDRLRRLEAEG